MKGSVQNKERERQTDRKKQRERERERETERERYFIPKRIKSVEHDDKKVFQKYSLMFWQFLPVQKIFKPTGHRL